MSDPDISWQSETRESSRRERTRRILFYIGLIVFILAASAAAGLYAFYRGGVHENGEGTMTRLTKPVNILVMGIDQRSNDPGRTDTMLLVNLDPEDNMVRVVSLPRDTRVEIPGRSGWHKINEAMPLGGPKAAMDTASRLLGVHVSHYAVIDFDGFEKIVDTLGGVSIDVERPMRYDDNAQNLHIRLEPGRQKLTGAQALGYVRFRNDGLGDVSYDPGADAYYGRVQRQQKFLLALGEQAASVSTLWKLPTLIKELLAAVQTDVTASQALRYAAFLKDLTPEQVETMTLPGSGQTIGGISYWVPDDTKLAALKEKLSPSAQGLGQVVFAHEVRTGLARVVGEGIDPSRVRIEVLNGNGQAGTAREVAELLEQAGFSVTSVGNADSYSYPVTQVVDWAGEARAAQLLAGAVGGVAKTKEAAGSGSRATSPADSDLTIIVGQNFRP